MITHQWSAGEVVYIERIHLQLEVNTVGVLCAAETTKVKLTGTARAFTVLCVMFVCYSPPANECLNEPRVALSCSQMQ